MIKKILVSVGLMTAGICFAAPLTPEEALSRVDRTDILGIGTRAAYAQPAMVMNTKFNEPTLYVFRGASTKGFVVVSADDNVVPVLGYSDEEVFDSENISPAMKDWLEQYSAQIEYARQQGYSSAGDAARIALPSSWTKIAPMVKTHWNQSTPYNEMCPLQGNTKCYTGCVATSMAQVMKYFNYPAKPKGNINYLCSSLNQRIRFDLSTLTFDWGNMINNYSAGSYTQKQAEAVATLMMAAGYSVEMNYTANVSGALSGLIPGAMVNNFGYDKSIRYYSRAPYSYTEWATMVYNNLKNVGPIIYDGNSTKSGGHSFVCDGYEGNGYFHFNWGWGGSGDGYYVLDALSPTNLGIGAGGGGFNFDQDALFNITPDKGSGDDVAENQVVLYGSVIGEIADGNLKLNLTGGSNNANGEPILGWSYQGLSSMTIDLGFKFSPVNNPNEVNYIISYNAYNTNTDLVPGQYMPPTGFTSTGRPVDLCPYIPLENLNLQQGVQYKVTNVYRPVDGNWVEVIYDHGKYNYFYLTKTGSGSNASDFSIQNFMPMQFTCSNLSLNSDLYNGIACNLSTTVKNANDVELTRGITVALLDSNGKLSFKGDTEVISLNPGETWTKEIMNILNPVNASVVVSRPTQFYLALYDEETGTIYYQSNETVTMKPNPGRPYFTSDITIDNAKWQSSRYVVEDSSDMQVTTTINVTRNIFSYPMMMNVLQELNSGTGGTSYSILLKTPYDLAVLNAGETKSFTTNVNFSGAIVGSTYYLGLIVNNESGLTGSVVPFFVQGNNAGVEELVSNQPEISLFYDRGAAKVIATGNVAHIEAYSLAGVKLAEVSTYGNEANLDVSSLGKGIVLVTATDTQGQKKTIKLAL